MKNTGIYILLLLIFISKLLNASQIQQDSVRVIYSWKLKENNTRILKTNIDTVLNDFQNYNPLFKNNISVSYLGNFGTAGISHNFKESFVMPDFIFARGYENYMHKTNNTEFYNTKKPYTNIMYSGGGTDDISGQNLKLVHTQNVNPYMNVGIKYDLISSVGHYNRQAAKNNSFTFFSSGRKRKYFYHSAVSLNKVTIEENGGLDSLADLSSNYPPNTLSVRLAQARSLINNKNFLLVQEYLLGPSDMKNPDDTTTVDSIIHPPFNTSSGPKLVHSLNYETSFRIYNDENPNSGFYHDVFNDTILTTNDSVRYRNISNSFQIVKDKNLFGKSNIGAKAMLVNQLLKYHYLEKDTNLLNNSLKASIYDIYTRNLNWRINSAFCFHGYRSGDYEFEVKVSKPFAPETNPASIGFNAALYRKTPDYFLSKYSSNHFFWDKNLSPEKIMNIDLFYNDENINLKSDLSWLNVKNYIFFDSLALPAQYEKNINILSFTLNKDFYKGNWTFSNKIIAQYTDNKNVVRIPTFSTYNSVYYKNTLFKAALIFQIGAQIRYNTAFYAYAYMPATGQFFLQDEKSLGNYPYADIFLNLKVSRTRFFLIYEHFNSWFMENNYYHVLHYPMKKAFFKFGLSWSFYD